MDRTRQDHSPGNCRRSNAAFTLVEMLVLLVILAFVMILLFSTLPEQRRRARQSHCANNLKIIGLAFKLWGSDYSKDTYPMDEPVSRGGTLEFVPTGQVFPHFQAMSNELETPKLLVCPSDTERDCATGFMAMTDSNVSYWVNVDIDEGEPGRWMSGDRNLSTNGNPVSRGLVILKTNMAVGWQNNVHVRVGNVLLCDGTIQQIAAADLPELLSRSNTATNRLFVP